LGRSRITSDTNARDTPASRATSSIVAGREGEWIAERREDCGMARAPYLERDNIAIVLERSTQ
jgi:hypothetical protein